MSLLRRRFDLWPDLGAVNSEKLVSKVRVQRVPLCSKPSHGCVGA